MSPVSKKAYARTHTAKGGVKAATMHQFNPSDLAVARGAVGVKRKLARDEESDRVNELKAEVEMLKGKLQHECQAKGERVQQLRKELAESQHEREIMARQYNDQLKTRMRENHRLKEDLRIMLERATEMRDERDAAEKLAENLQGQLDLAKAENTEYVMFFFSVFFSLLFSPSPASSLTNNYHARALRRERDLSMELIAGVNKKNKEIIVQKAIVTSLSAKCQELEDKNDALEDDLEKYKEALEEMMSEAQLALTLFGNSYQGE